jgi:hypothetical protein
VRHPLHDRRHRGTRIPERAWTGALVSELIWDLVLPEERPRGLNEPVPRLERRSSTPGTRNYELVLPREDYETFFAPYERWDQRFLDELVAVYLNDQGVPVPARDES